MPRHIHSERPVVHATELFSQSFENKTMLCTYSIICAISTVIVIAVVAVVSATKFRIARPLAISQHSNRIDDTIDFIQEHCSARAHTTLALPQKPNWQNVGTLLTDAGDVLMLEGRRHPTRRHRFLYRALSTNRHQQITLDIQLHDRDITHETGVGCSVLHTDTLLFVPQLRAVGTAHVHDGTYIP